MFTPIPPELLEQWHPTKNNNLDPKTISRWKRITVWWQCELGHEWQRSIESRNKKGGEFSPCPVCSGMRIHAGFNDLATVNPRVASEWHPIKNGDLKPSDVGIGDGRKVWWLGKCDHEWESSVGNRTNIKTGTNCPYCSGNKVLAGFNDLVTTHPDLAKEWHPTKNKVLSPTMVNKGSERVVWWLGECGHEWKTYIFKRTYGAGCHYCSNNKVLTGLNDFVSHHPQLVAELHPTKNKDLDISKLAIRTKQKIWWQCEKGHEWKTGVSARTRPTRASNCPYCGNKRIIEGENDFASAFPVLAKEWHSTLNGELLPTEVSIGSNRKVFWQCENEHEWQATITDRVSKGYGCPNCSHRISKAEQDIFEFVSTLGFTAVQSDRKVLKGKELDIYFPEKNVAVEFNGLYWHSEEAGKDKTYHYNKWLECKEQGIRLIQIWEDDWNRNPEQVKRMLSSILGVAVELTEAEDTRVVELGLGDVKAFLDMYHVDGFAGGSHFLGLCEQGDIEKITAVMVLDYEPDSKGTTLEIVRFTSVAGNNHGFGELLDYACATVGIEQVSVFSDHAVCDGSLYSGNGFVEAGEVDPVSMFIVNGERVSSLLETELAVLNGIPRIWDAGKTRWVKKV